MDGWTRGEKIALYTLLVGIIGVLVGLLTVPEFRRVMGFYPERTSKSSTTEAAKSESRTVSDQSPVPSFSPQIVRSYRTVFRIYGNAGWQSVHMRVTKGTWVSISASGSVTWDPTLPAVGVDGAAFSASGLQNSLDFPMPSAACGALIMRIGDTKYFVGSITKIQAQNDGEIEFMVNDRLNSLSDNNGSFMIEVKKE